MEFFCMFCAFILYYKITRNSQIKNLIHRRIEARQTQNVRNADTIYIPKRRVQFFM